MPSRPSKEVRVYCKKCQEYTQGENPVTIRRASNTLYDMYIQCCICKEDKYQRLNAAQKKVLPPEILNMPIKSEVKNEIERSGGLFPLIPLIGAIAAGISALAGAGGAAAAAVQRGQANAEQARHNRELERMASGKGVTLVSDTPLEQADCRISDDEMTDRCTHYLRERGYDVRKTKTKKSENDKIDKAIDFLEGKGYDISFVG